jgi:cytidylate kinase
MRRAPDAVEIDTTILTAEEVVSIIAGIVAKRAEG